MSTRPTTSQLIMFGVTEFLTSKVRIHNARLNYVSNPPTVFSGRHDEPMSASRYIRWLLKEFETSPGVLVIMLIYIDRLLSGIDSEYRAIGGRDQILFTSYNAHRMILTSLMVAHKYWEDRNYRLASFARVGGIDRNELINLEIEMLYFMGYKLFVSEEEYDNYWKAIIIFGTEAFTRMQP